MHHNHTKENLRASALVLYLGLLICLLLMVLVSTPARADRVKDLATIGGVRNNQLLGYGLVVGLDGSGDKDTNSPYTLQSLKNMLTRLGIVVPPKMKFSPKNVALVSLQARLPAFAKIGQKIDVTAASIGNAKSLRGGTLLMAPLKGADGKIYAIAQGELIVSGLNAEGKDGSNIRINVPQVGRIPNGATVERLVPTSFNKGDAITLNLHRSDFTTVQRLTDAINEAVGPGTAMPVDGITVSVNAPKDPGQRVRFVALLEELQVKPAIAKARVIVNTRTGTVVINSEVRVSPAAVSHGNLVVSISEELEVSQPNALARRGRTAIVPNSDIEVFEDSKRMFLFNPGVNLEDVVRAVNEVGAGPSDLAAILEALKEAGALHAELLVI